MKTIPLALATLLSLSLLSVYADKIPVTMKCPEFGGREIL